MAALLDRAGHVSQTKDAVIRLQTLDGVWEVGGVDRKRGIAPENDTYTADEWGPLEAQFDLRRDPRAVWPDLGAYTPVEVEIGGVKVWSGRVSDTPSKWGGDMVMTVKCKGWQVQLDDDQYEKTYVHNRLSDWRDLRSFLTTTINRGGMAAGQVTSDRGAITMGWPKGAQVTGASAPAVGVTMDLGPASTAKRVVIGWQKISATASAGLINLVIRGHDTEDGVNPASFENALNADVSTLAASGTTGFTFMTARRYVTVMVQVVSGAVSTMGEDQFFRITSAQLFADAAYESGNASALLVPTVVKDGLNQATVGLSADQSLIDPNGQATFPLPSFAPGEPQTPREVWAAANGLYDWVSQIDVEKRPVFKPKPTSPIFEVGDYTPFEFDDASQNDGDEIYNRVIVTGTTPDGAPMRIDRAAGDTDSTKRRTLTSPAPDNPSFDTNTTSWSTSGGAGAGTITRDTTTSDSSPASGKWSSGGRGNADRLIETFTGKFKAGTRYILTFAAKASVSTNVTVLFGDTGAPGGPPSTALTIGTSFAGFEVSLTPTVDSSTVTLAIGAGLSSADIWIDSLKLLVPAPTLVDRRGFRRTKRLPISIPLPSDGALGRQIADTWLGSHKLTPFKGDTTIVGDQAVRSILGGVDVPLERLLLNTQQLLRFSDRIDPDTGGQARDGRLTKVTFDRPNNSAKVTIDNTRTSFEALLGRLAAVVTG